MAVYAKTSKLDIVYLKIKINLHLQIIDTISIVSAHNLYTLHIEVRIPKKKQSEYLGQETTKLSFQIRRFLEISENETTYYAVVCDTQRFPSDI